jgi:methyl-accepting chemotaxis protein
MLANINIKTKLFVLVLIPVLALLGLSFLTCLDRYQTLTAMHTLSEMVPVAVSDGGLMHELQKERGLSSGFLASKGQNFRNELGAQRLESQKAQAQFEKALAAFDAKHPGSALGRAMSEARSALNGLSQTRQSVDGLQAAPAGVIAAYNKLIDSLLGGLDGVLALCEEGQLYGQAMAYLSLLKGKEFAGQERATLNGALSAGTFNKELYRGWIARMTGQDEHFKVFLALAASSPKAAYDSKVGPKTAEVESFRKAAFDSQDKPKLDGDPQAWFRASTARIDAMREVEASMAMELSSVAERLIENARGDFIISLVASLVVSTLALALGWLIMRDITVTLDRTVTFASAVAGGNLEQCLMVERRDELGTLSSALCTMVESLREMIAKAQAAQEEAGREAGRAREAAGKAEEATRQAQAARREGMLMAADKLDGVVMGLTSASEQLTEEVDSASRGASLQAERVAETATAMEEMNATVLEVARSASSAAATSSHARQEAVTGAEVVRDAVAGITQARDDSLELKRHMGELDQRAKDIGRIMGVISDIADQTNLLALNAAIEAARAGEAGRGFAVVADEVRKLAEKTMTATKEVAESIQGIQKGAADTIANVEKAVGRIEEATTLAEKSGQALTSIVKYVDDASLQVSSIAAASEEQSAASEEINRSLEDVNRVSAETAQAMGHSAQAVTELARQAQELKKLIESLRRS